MPSPRFGPGLLFLVLGAALALPACAGGPAPEAAATGPGHMADHYTQVDLIQEAVISGDLRDVRGHARWIASHRGLEYGPAAAPALEAMRNEGRIMMEQDQILQVSRTLGRMGVACGSCHTALKSPVRFPVEEPPPSSASPREHMLRHAWAVDRLWEGLVGPSDASWRAGAGALAHMPVNFGGNAQANTLAQRVHDLRDAADAASTADARARVYGDLLESCALCHGALRMQER